MLGAGPSMVRTARAMRLCAVLRRVQDQPTIYAETWSMHKETNTTSAPQNKRWLLPLIAGMPRVWGRA